MAQNDNNANDDDGDGDDDDDEVDDDYECPKWIGEMNSSSRAFSGSLRILCAIYREWEEGYIVGP